MALLLGYDVGSSSIKATLMDAGTGQVLAAATSPDKELEIVAKQAARIPELAEVEEKVEADLINEKKNEKAKTDAEALLSALKDGGTIETIGKKFDLTPMSTGFFKRNVAIPNIGFERELSRAAFELSEKSSLPKEVFQGGKGFYVIKFKQRKTPATEEF